MPGATVAQSRYESIDEIVGHMRELHNALHVHALFFPRGVCMWGVTCTRRPGPCGPWLLRVQTREGSHLLPTLGCIHDAEVQLAVHPAAQCLVDDGSFLKEDTFLRDAHHCAHVPPLLSGPHICGPSACGLYVAEPYIGYREPYFFPQRVVEYMCVRFFFEFGTATQGAASTVLNDGVCRQPVNL